LLGNDIVKEGSREIKVFEMFAKRLMPLLSLRFFVVYVVLHGFDWLIE